MIGLLPRQLDVNGKMYDIRTDYRNCLLILTAFNDAENTLEDAYDIMINVLFKEIPEDIKDAVDKAIWFLNCGDAIQDEELSKKPLFNWEQDEHMLFSAINNVAGREVRNDKYMHFWTFIGLFQGIGEGYFSAVVSIRDKLNKGKTLDKTEKEFYNRNKGAVILKERLTEEEQERKDFINKMFD